MNINKRCRSLLRVCTDVLLIGIFVGALFRFAEHRDNTFKKWTMILATAFGGTIGFLVILWMAEIWIALYLAILQKTAPQLELTGVKFISELLSCKRCAAKPKPQPPHKAHKGGIHTDMIVAMRRRIATGTSGTAYALSVIAWNFGWALSWLLSTKSWRREDYTDTWNFSHVPFGYEATQAAFISGATLHFCIKTLGSVSLARFIFSIHFLVDLLTLAPAICVAAWSRFSSYSFRDYLYFVGWIRWLRTFVIVRILGSSSVWRGSKTTARVFQLLLGIAIFLLTFASAMFTVQGTVIDGDATDPPPKFPMWSWFYFAVVTMSTVGYGDISPESGLPQLYTVAFICAIIAWIPSEINELVSTFGDKRKGIGPLPYKGRKHHHILLCGAISPQQLSSVLCEIANSQAEENTKVVLLTPRDSSDYNESVVLARHLQLPLCIVCGDVGLGGDVEGSHICCPKTAASIMVIANTSAADRAQEEYQCITRLLGLRKLKCDMGRVVMKNPSTASCGVAFNMGVRSHFNSEYVKVHLLLRSLSGSPGIITMFSNLTVAMRPIVKHGVNSSAEVEYVAGTANVVFSFQPPKWSVGALFKSFAIYMHRVFQLVVIGIGQRPRSDGISYISCWLNPERDYLLEPTDLCFVIAKRSSLRKTLIYLKSQHSAPSAFHTYGLSESHNKQDILPRITDIRFPLSVSPCSALTKQASRGAFFNLGDTNYVTPSVCQVHSYKEAATRVWKDTTLPLLLICGFANSLYTLLTAVKRSRRWNVMILSSSMPQIQMFREFQSFTALLIGHPISVVNLKLAGIIEAEKILVLPLGLHGDYPTAPKSADEAEYSVTQKLNNDRACVVVHLLIRDIIQEHPSSKILETDIIKHVATEVNFASSMEFFNFVAYGCPDEFQKCNFARASVQLHTIAEAETDQKERVKGKLEPAKISCEEEGDIDLQLKSAAPWANATALKSRAFASGFIHSEELLDSLLMQTLPTNPYAPHQDVFLALLGADNNPLAFEDNSLPAEYHNQFSKGGIHLIQNPFGVDISFGEAFVSLLDLLHCLAVGVRATEGFYSYAITCPRSSRLVGVSEEFYVIFQSIPYHSE